MFIGVLAMLGLLGAVFAFGGAGFGKQMLEKGEEISKELQIEFMKAMHEGDYASAKALNEEYGLGGRMVEFASEEMFSIHSQIKSALKAGDYELAYELREQAQELGMEQGKKMCGGMQAGVQECAEDGKCPQKKRMMDSEGIGKERSMHGKTHPRDCPLADATQ